MKRLAVFLLCALCLGYICGCEEDPSAVSGEQSETSSDSESAEESSEEESLPEPEVMILLYEHYLTVTAKRDAVSYEYTYCFGEDGTVFNAIAAISYPNETAAQSEYRQLLDAGYPNLALDGCMLTFSFPKKECPYFGVSYTALPYLLEETVYTVKDACLPSDNSDAESA